MANPTALVTGASSGIGEVFAQQLARRSYDLVLVARCSERLQTLAARLKAEAGVGVEVLSTDLTDQAGLRRVEARAAQAPLDLLVNNAGFAVYKPLAESDPATLEEMIALNVLALTRLTRAALPPMLARGSGAIINVASGLAFLPQATRATYTGSKAFVLNFSQALSEEVNDAGVRVQVLVPGLTPSEFHLRSGTDLSRFPSEIVMSAEDLVRASLKGLELDETVCIPGLHDPSYVRSGTPTPRYR